MSELNRAYFMKKRDEKLAAYLDELESAPVKREWNSFLKQQIPSQRDVTAKCQQYLQNLNTVCVSLKDSKGKNLKPIWEQEPDDDPGLAGGPVD